MTVDREMYADQLANELLDSVNEMAVKYRLPVQEVWHLVLSRHIGYLMFQLSELTTNLQDAGLLEVPKEENKDLH